MPSLPDGSHLSRRYLGRGPPLQYRHRPAGPSPTSPRSPGTGEPLPVHWALTCREPDSGAAPWSSRGSGQAGGRPAGGRAGRSARESPAPIAELRLLGPLNPRAAGRARPLALRPASGPVASVREALGVSTRAAAAGSGGCCCEESARARPGSCRGWAGGGTESPCSRVPAFAPPPPGGAPAATTQSPAPGAGGARGGDEGNLKSLRSLPSAPPPQAPPLLPRFC